MVFWYSNSPVSELVGSNGLRYHIPVQVPRPVFSIRQETVQKVNEIHFLLRLRTLFLFLCPNPYGCAEGENSSEDHYPRAHFASEEQRTDRFFPRGGGGNIAPRHRTNGEISGAIFASKTSPMKIE
jgi:hypothetical protein